MFSGCSQFFTDIHLPFSDVIKMCSDLLRCLQMIAVVLVFSLDVPKMISGCSQDFSKRFSGCSDGSCGIVGWPGGSHGFHFK